ncbi:MAG: SAM-dependent methyltransferase [Selenomonas sp.]|uniref:N-6 DNA methylase n=1 Tax=Selenomonas sp. TaxID=2053611 RepID=UPI002600115E|nr:N-6 DNA methylase [Selenomonas sp.]MCR5438130.1 SAM-dependent methyltransferase [Selenomonas sp.]
MEKLIKSKDRVNSHGEVFTPSSIVKKMLNIPEIKNAIYSINKTVLEPSAGEGAFLTEVLHRKLKTADRLSKNIDEYNHFALIALTSVFGIELQEDNMEMLVMNIYATFIEEYLHALKKYHSDRNNNVISSAKYIIQTNMMQGDFLTQRDSDDNPIIVTEWKTTRKKGKCTVKRIQHLLSEIINDEQAPLAQEVEYFDMFTGDAYSAGNQNIFHLYEYPDMEICKLYQPVEPLNIRAVLY